MKRSTPLTRGKPLRRTRMKAKPPKGCPPAVTAKLVERSFGLCEANTPACTGTPSVPHHIIRRPLPARILWALPLILFVCPQCHSAVHHDVKLSEALGHLVRRHSPEGRALLAEAEDWAVDHA